MNRLKHSIFKGYFVNYFSIVKLLRSKCDAEIPRPTFGSKLFTCDIKMIG